MSQEKKEKEKKTKSLIVNKNPLNYNVSFFCFYIPLETKQNVLISQAIAFNSHWLKTWFSVTNR